VWDTGVGIGTFQFADWIWQSYRVQTPTVDETVTFKREFTPPGPVAPGSWMKVTTDDEYTATLNGTQVAADVWPNWPSVETASPFDPVSGLNTLLFVAVNSNKSYGPDGTIDNNPGGLIYEAGINYFTHSESAWAGTAPYTTDFPGANWATYFQFLGNPTLNTCPTIPGTYYANFELSGSNVAWPPSGEMAACLIPNDVTVNGNIKMTGGTLRVNGHVNGNMEQSGDGGGLVVQNGAVVVGNLTENGAGFLRIDDNANVTGTVTEYGDGDIAMTVTALVTGNLFEWGNGNITLGGTSHVQGDATENGPGFVTVAATASVSGTITNNP
jgi:hypothetical protein